MLRRVRIWAHASRSRDRAVSAFARGPGERALKVVVDVDSFSNAEQLTELLGFAANQHVEIEQVRLKQIRIDEGGHASLDRSDGKRTGWNAIRSVGHNIAAMETWGERIAFEVDPQLRERLALVMYAERNQCDALVTESAEVLRLTQKWHVASNALNLSDAFAILGLHLRLREDFVIFQQPGATYLTSGADFYLDLAEHLLEQWPRWRAACPGPEAPLGQSLAGTARAVPVRMARALRARDRLHGQLFREPSDTAVDEALFYFDALLVALAGAFDAVARVAQSAYRLSNRPRPSWRSHEWRTNLVAADREFGDVLAEGSEIRATVDGVVILRNFIHDEPLQVMGILGSGDRITEFRAAVPPSERVALLAATARLGGAEQWGLVEVGDGLVSMDLGAYTEALVPRAVDALSALMRLTKVERIADVSTAVDCAPADALGMSPQKVLARLRLLSGL